MTERVFNSDVVNRSLRPNQSPIVEHRIAADPGSGSSIIVGIHEDGSMTILSERTYANPAPSGAGDGQA